MSSDVQSTVGMTTQASVSGAFNSEPGTTLPSPTAAAEAQGGSFLDLKGSSSNTSDSVQESGQVKFVTTSSSVSTTSFLSYGVVPKVITTSGSSQHNSSPPAMNSTVAATTTSLQPPVPGQSLATGPSFSYNVTTNINVGSSSGQQFPSSNALGSGFSQNSKSTPSTTVASLQPPVPGNHGHSNLSTSGMAGPMTVPVHSPVPVPKGASSIAAGFSFSRPLQLPAAVDDSCKDPASNSNTSTTMPQETGTSTIHSFSSQTVPLALSTSTTSAHVPPNLYPAGAWKSTTPSFIRSPGMLGPPGLSPTASFSSTVSVRSTTPVMPSAVPIPSNPAVQQQIYPLYPSLPAISPPQAHWTHPPQAAGLQRPPYQPYPNVLSNPFPLPGMALPSVSVPDSHPPGVSPVGPPGRKPLSTVASGQLASGSGMQPDLPPGIDHDKSPNGVGGKEELDVWSAHKSNTGAVYYYNAVTGESTYQKPSGFKGKPDKVTDQPTPVSCEKLAGTDWALVNTNDGKKYYYNTVTKVSSWHIPIEVTELRKRQEADALKANNTNSVLHEKGPAPVTLSTPVIGTGGRDATALRPSGGPSSSSALDLIKKKLQDPGMPITSSPPPTSSGPVISDLNGLKDATVKGLQGENSKDKQKETNGNQHMSDSSSDSEDVDSGPTKEECIIQFKEMLKERGVAPFSKWEKELPKILFDPRFKAVPGYSTRRSLFEHYVRTRAEEERKEKRAAQRAAVEGFKQLLEEASKDIDHKIDYQLFKRKWGNDPRFEALDRKERETLLNERVLPLKKAAEEKIRDVRAAATSGFKSMLREKGDIDTSTRWSRVKDSLRNDPRYKSVKHEDREALFEEYVSELKSAEQEVQRAEKAKKEEKDKLKERERETRKRKEREEQEMERVRLKVRRKEAISSYQALLVEIIKDPQASWTESKPRLEKDPQGRACNPDLDQVDAEKLFREHVKMLYDRCARDFQVLLAEVITVEAANNVTEDGKTGLTSWSTAKRLLKADPRYTKMPRKERESLWRRYAEDMQRKQKLESDPVEEKFQAETKNRSSRDSGRSPAGSRRNHGRR